MFSVCLFAVEKMFEKRLYVTKLLSNPLQVSSLFKDGTIGTDINIVVVGLLLLEHDPVSGFGLTLQNFT